MKGCNCTPRELVAILIPPCIFLAFCLFCPLGFTSSISTIELGDNVTIKTYVMSQRLSTREVFFSNITNESTMWWTTRSDPLPSGCGVYDARIHSCRAFQFLGSFSVFFTFVVSFITGSRDFLGRQVHPTYPWWLGASLFCVVCELGFSVALVVQGFCGRPPVTLLPGGTVGPHVIVVGVSFLLLVMVACADIFCRLCCDDERRLGSGGEKEVAASSTRLTRLLAASAPLLPKAPIAREREYPPAGVIDFLNLDLVDDDSNIHRNNQSRPADGDALLVRDSVMRGGGNFRQDQSQIIIMPAPIPFGSL